MSYFIKHLIETRSGKKMVNLRDALVETCKKCNKQVPVFFYGETHIYKETCVYKPNDIIEEYSNTLNGVLGKKCKSKGCNKLKY